MVEEKIVTRIKIEHFTHNPEDFEPIVNLAETLSKRLVLPVHIINDGKAGALTVSRLTNTTDVLCLGLCHPADQRGLGIRDTHAIWDAGMPGDWEGC